MNAVGATLAVARKIGNHGSSTRFNNGISPPVDKKFPNRYYIQKEAIKWN